MLKTVTKGNRLDHFAPVVNTSGIEPTEYKIVIKPVDVGEKIGSIIIPQESKDRHQFAQMEGDIVAVAPLAFSYASKDDWAAVDARPPGVGDRVLFAKFAGAIHKGKDGVEYRIVNDKDVCARLT